MTNSQLSIKQPSIELSPNTVLYGKEIDKTFTLHNQGSIEHW